MSTALTPEPSTPEAEAAAPDPRRWKALGVLGLIQFMLVLDITVVNVALPRIQDDLGFSRAGLAWVVNGYVLMAGGLLLLGGRMADILGRRRLFLLGVGVFAIASATCGAAADPGMLVASRFLQGAGEAMAAPASLGLIALLFPDPHERMKALGLWGGIAGLGGTSGTVISGALVDLASWRWIFFVNLPVALFALVTVPRLVSESRMVREAKRPDYAGAITGTAATARRFGAAGADGPHRGGLRRTADTARFFQEPHPGRDQLRDAVLLVGVLQLLLLTDPFRAADTRLLAAEGRPVLPAVRAHDRRRHRTGYRVDAADRRQAAARRRLHRLRHRPVSHQRHRRQLDVRGRCAAGHDGALAGLRNQLPGDRQRVAARGDRAGFVAGVRRAERDATGRRRARAVVPGDA